MKTEEGSSSLSAHLITTKHMKEEILKITKEDSEYEVIATGNNDDIVKALTEHLVNQSVKGNRTALDILFSVTVHFLSIGNNKFAEEYISNLKSHIAKENNSIATLFVTQKQSS